MREGLGVIGKSLLRNEDPFFLTGQAAYVADVQDPVLEKAVHAVFVRSIYAHATIASIDLSEALAAPGVVGAISGVGLPVAPEKTAGPMIPARFRHPFLAPGKVRFVGEPVAVVMAETRALAVDAAELVNVDYEVLAPVVSVTDALENASELFDGGNVVLTEADEGFEGTHHPEKFAEADVLVRERFVNPRQVAAPMECRGAAAAWAGDEIHLWASTQRPHKMRDMIAAAYGMKSDNVHVIAGPFVGGGFGGKGAVGTEEQLLPHLSRVAGRPVRWTETRTENLTAAVHGRAEELEVWLAGSADGKMEAVRVELLKDAGAYPSSGATLPNHYSRPMVNGAYNIAHVEFAATVVVTNKPPVAALRGAGRAPLVAALERAVDIYAAKTQMDPADVRRKNLISPAEMPYTTATGGVYDEADYTAELQKALDRAGYHRLRVDQNSRRNEQSPLQLGIGIASFNHRTCGGGTEQAMVTINADGSATIVTGTTSQGHGHAITWAQLASDDLGIPVDQIDVIEGVTDEIATGLGAIGSRSLQTAGMAIHEASAEIVSWATNLAADMFEAAEADIVFLKGEGVFHVAGTPARTLGWAELSVEGKRRDTELSCDYVYDPEGKDVYPSGCHIAVVETDVETGSWKLVKYVAVDDAGIRVNPMIVDGQLHGGIALGAAQVLGEEVIHDAAGNPLTSTFLDYQVASIDQFCQFDLESHEVASSFNPRGYKAVGESGPIGATPAVHNAVMDSVAHLTSEHIDIPCTPEKVWRAIQRSPST